MALMIASCTTASAYHLEKGELSSGNKPVGEPHTSKQTDIRMVRVSSMQEADSLFVALCQNRKYDHIFTCQHNGMDVQYYRNGMTNGEMIHTHKVSAGTYDVDIIYIMDSIINVEDIR